MSSYRDDTQETAVAASEALGRMASLVVEMALATSLLLGGTTALLTDTAQASDDTTGVLLLLTHEQAQAEGQALLQLHAHTLVAETARASERLTLRGHLRHEAQAQASDECRERLRVRHADTVRVHDQVTQSAHATQMVEEVAAAMSSTWQIQRVPVIETAQCVDAAPNRLRGRSASTDSATVQDAQWGQAHLRAPITEVARIGATVSDWARRRDWVVESAFVQDGMDAQHGHGQVWTAAVDGWAMSRYWPVAVVALVVIDGKLYGMADDGIYQLQDGAGMVRAALQTGLLDIGQGGQMHPVACHITQRLPAGRASLQVTTVQEGRMDNFVYPLLYPCGPQLCAGRFVLGRGLRGRHFVWRIEAAAQGGEISDINLELAASRRRI